ncbi:MAG: hypothetical protein FWF76_00050 [Oscillospiraceae bacterium]|nr:hypothetical protein [Oscillospiraceae bacterium]
MKVYEAIKNLTTEQMEKFLDQVFLTGMNAGNHMVVDPEIYDENPFDEAWLNSEAESSALVENFILTEVSSVGGTAKISEFNGLLTNSTFIFGNTEPRLTRREMRKQKSTIVFAEVDNLRIYRNCEDKYKADFMYRGNEYKGFSITDPKFLNCERKIESAKLLFSLPDAPYN